MPKLTIVVDKDETGKLWDYSFAQEDLASIKGFGISSLSIHKPDSITESIRNNQTAINETDGVTIGVLPFKEEEIEIFCRKK